MTVPVLAINYVLQYLNSCKFERIVITFIKKIYIHIFIYIIKGTLIRDFRPLVFSSNNSPKAPDTRVKAFLNMASNSRRKSTIKSPIFVTVVSMTPL
jgi:hypothetical protein